MTTDNPQDGWCETTAETMLRERQRIKFLERLRDSLYPGFAAIDYCWLPPPEGAAGAAAPLLPVGATGAAGAGADFGSA
ncbi:hypothetical protein [Rhizobium viscosum]|uniref:Uncharacterized protein n=1 Tax=Rhizobium viscosum TaxID=1673 RepID=A0ABR9IYI7_RHIVS|nr:hypothetical protein [Rhizobium viscosum]MBE1508265.1 hypothetical protein [Rhizobium viscosum]